MRLLVLVAGYPDLEGNISMYYAHTRNLYYIKKGYKVDVLNFSTEQDYKIDGIEVFSKVNLINKLVNTKYDILISHAPNIRSHYIFFKKYGKSFQNIVIFFHGHEVLRTSKVYSKPYDYMKKEKINIILDLYDTFKLYAWKKYLPKIASKTQFVFVSSWMKEQFLKWTQIPLETIVNCSSIAYNSVGKIFETESYDFNSDKKYDFITIRNNLDGSKYAIDIVCEIARQLPQYRFCIIGCGEFFSHYSRPQNLHWHNKVLNHNEIIEFLNLSKCALLPTRTDAQGVMACEIATYGIPLITSNIDVCKEVFEEFNNVRYIDNDNINLKSLLEDFHELSDGVPYDKNKKYYEENTCKSEADLFEKLI